VAQGRLKPGGIILIVGFAVAIVGFGFWAAQQRGNGGDDGDGTAKSGDGDGGGATSGGGGATGGGGGGGGATGGDGGLTGTLQDEFEEVGKQGPPQLSVRKGSYDWDDANPTVVFPINIWAGWGPIIAANDGFAPGSPNSLFKKYGFEVELRLIDDPVQAAEAYASGQAHTMWGTLDMIALFAPQLKQAGLTPKVYQQVDWSQGGDGVVVRSSIRTVKDLRGKTIALCRTRPRTNYILHLLNTAGLSVEDVSFRFTQTAFGASALFAQDGSVHACVSWAPDIYTLTDPEQNPGGRARLLSTTVDASNVIADVWAVRPDFAREHPDIVEGLVKGILEGVDKLGTDKKHVAALMAEGYGMPPEECEAMMLDAYPTGLGDNARFFLMSEDQNKANFSGTWRAAVDAYERYGAIQGTPVPASEVMDGSIIKQLQDAGEFAHQEAQNAEFAPPTVDLSRIEASADEEVLRVPLQIHFEPNKWELNETVDPKLPETLSKIQELAQRFRGARIIIEGNVDTSRKNAIRAQGPRVYSAMTEAVQKLSEKRADSVRDRLVDLLPDEDPDRFVSFGNGWDNPVDPLDHSKNRRVDVRVIRVE